MAPDYPRLALYAFALAVVGALVVAGSTSATAFGAYNPGWEGTSALQDLADETDAESRVVRDASRYETLPGNGTIAFVLSPSTSYDEAAASDVRAFVERGGTLVVAGDVDSAGNALLADLETDARVDGRLVRDEHHYADGPVMPVARNASNHSLTAGVDRLTLNYGSAVRTDGNATTLVATSSFAYVDENGNGELDDSETLGARPVATVEPVGDGRVIVVGDPSAFINAMLAYPDNERFARNLVGAHDRVAFDVSHLGSLPPLRLGLLVIRDSALVQFAVGIGGVLAVARRETVYRGLRAASRRVGRRRSETPEADRDAVVDRLRARHPDWDDDRIKRVTQGVIARRRESSGDE